ncbi:MdtA/MuxA family multidrug efflux RND transporter periplasmic adaptor subunit [soil metagenome]
MTSSVSRWTVRLTIGVVCIAAVVWYLRAHSAAGSHATTQAAGAPGKGSGAARVVPVQAAIAEKRDFPVWLDGLGSVAAYQSVTVHTQVDGRLDAVTFTEGQTVKKGDVIASIDPRPLLVQLHNAQGAYSRDQAQAMAAKADYDRQKNLHAQNLVAQNVVDAAAGVLGNYQGSVKIDQAAIESAQLNLDYARIKAPIDGITGVRLIDAGNIVRTSDATGLVVIAQINPTAVIFTLPQDRLTDITSAMAAGNVEVEIYNRDGATLLGKGNLAVLDNQVNATTATMRMKAIVPNEARTLWPNAFVKARVLVGIKKGAVVVPAAAVQQGPNGVFVYVIATDSTVKMTPVLVALTQGDTSVIDKGLAGGEHVVIEGASQLRNGGKVDTGEGNHRGSAGTRGTEATTRQPTPPKVP